MKKREMDFARCSAICFRAHGESAHAIGWLMDEVKKYRLWIDEIGEQQGICTFNILGVVCSDCGCKRAQNNGP